MSPQQEEMKCLRFRWVWPAPSLQGPHCHLLGHLHGTLSLCVFTTQGPLPNLELSRIIFLFFSEGSVMFLQKNVDFCKLLAIIFSLS